MWVVDEHDVCLFENGAQPVGVDGVDLFVDAQQGLGDAQALALKGVVEGLRAGEEVLVPLDDLPAGSSPSSCMSGTSFSRISATPPPLRVEFTCTTFRPARGLASWRSCSMAS